ncbi:hypothetical protein [Photobacterium leiognathi]|uniref:hypothetical protein n=1 Tax=Photobacterium leiognathi TaxID=553611 RepID=UPI0027356340|nr:hypothetical protein [Photobacterium leiognathi]
MAAIALTAFCIARTIENHGNEAVFSSSYVLASAVLNCPQTPQGRFFNLIGGQSIICGDYPAGASEVILPHVIGDMEVYSLQTAWKIVEENTEAVHSLL